MFREMQLKREALDEASVKEILEKGTSGVLALQGEDGYPYAVPVSYFYNGKNKIYFHGAKKGYKMDMVKQCDKASFCVIGQDQVVPEEYTSYFKSVIAFGRVRIMEDKKEIRAMIEKMADKYHPSGTTEERNAMIDSEWNILAMIEFTIEHISGKQARELIK